VETFVGDTVELQLYTTIDLSAYTTLLIIFRRPDGTTGFWIAAPDGVDPTIAVYTTVEADLNMVGKWKLHVYAEDGTFRGHGRICELMVLEALSPVDDVTSLAPTTLVPTTV